MGGVRFETRMLPMSPLGAPGELILHSGGGRVATAAEAELLGVDDTHADRPPTVLPHRFQDSYDRDVVDAEHRVAVLENERLVATFLLDLGGRLWTLTRPSDSRTRREGPAMRRQTLPRSVPERRR